MKEFTTGFDLDCRACLRLATFLDEILYKDNYSNKMINPQKFEIIFKQIDELLGR